MRCVCFPVAQAGLLVTELDGLATDQCAGHRMVTAVAETLGSKIAGVIVK